MYCVKCRQKTETLNPKEHLTKNNRQILKCQCEVCGITKYSFVSKEKSFDFSPNKKSGGFVNTLLNSGMLPEMHLPGGYNYLGPGTKLKCGPPFM